MTKAKAKRYSAAEIGLGKKRKPRAGRSGGGGGIRSQRHPGKFEGEPLYLPMLYLATLDGSDEEAGSVSENGVWYGLLRAPIYKTKEEAEQAAHSHGIAPLTGDEVRLLTRKSGGFILSENDQGFVSVDVSDTTGGLNKKWKRIEADVGEFYSDESGFD